MDDPEKEAREARARQLREDMEKAKSGDKPPPKKESPHDFVQRRMRELEEEKKRQKPAD